METYVVLRRGAWRQPADLQAAAVRSMDEADRTPDYVRWLRSYVLAEPSGELGTVCIYEAASPEAIRTHAYRAGMPVDEIVVVADTLIVNSFSSREEKS
jgi:hypothetical protein